MPFIENVSGALLEMLRNKYTLSSLYNNEDNDDDDNDDDSDAACSNSLRLQNAQWKRFFLVVVSIVDGEKRTAVYVDGV